jgi:hypothetical protein
MTIMTTTFSSLDGIRSEQRKHSVWRQFLDWIIEARTRKAEHEVAEYLKRHWHHLPPQVRIEFEHRSVGP